MKLAVQEGLLPGETFAQKLEYAEKLGFEGVEVRGWGLFGRVNEIKEALTTSKVKVSSICAGYSGCLLSPNKEERERAMRDIENLLKIAKSC